MKLTSFRSFQAKMGIDKMDSLMESLPIVRSWRKWRTRNGGSSNGLLSRHTGSKATSPPIRGPARSVTILHTSLRKLNKTVDYLSRSTRKKTMIHTARLKLTVVWETFFSIEEVDKSIRGLIFSNFRVTFFVLCKGLNLFDWINVTTWNFLM